MGPAQENELSGRAGNECRVGAKGTIVAASGVFSASIEMRGRVTRDGKFKRRGEKSSGGDQSQRNIVEGRRKSSCKTRIEGDRRGEVKGC